MLRSEASPSARFAARAIFWRVAPALLALSATVVLASDGDRSAKDQAEKRQKTHQSATQELEAGKSTTRIARDWSRYPAIVELTTTEEVFGLGDVHGGHDRLVALLLAAGLVKEDEKSEVGYSWSGGRRALICVGDVIDKGDQSLAAIDLMIALEAGAAAVGGRVVVTLGNHEAEFLADPGNKKAKREFDRELTTRKLDRSEVSAGRGRYGEWLVQRPLAARVNGWFFSHGGSTSGMSVSALADAYRKAVDGADWGADFLVGKDSILEAQKWWKAGALEANLAALGVRHIVFGHDPGAFDAPGRIAQKFDSRLFRIDVGMSPAIDFSHGALLWIHPVARGEEVMWIDASGVRRAL